MLRMSDLRGDLDVPDEADGLHSFDNVVVHVDLVPHQAVTRRFLEPVVVVVPTFAPSE